jgi:hypothetical protein
MLGNLGRAADPFGGGIRCERAAAGAIGPPAGFGSGGIDGRSSRNDVHASLGSLDPMTRTDVYVQGINPSQPVWESISRARGPRVVSVSLLMRCHATFLIIPRSR